MLRCARFCGYYTIEIMLNMIKDSDSILELYKFIDIARWNTIEAGCDRAYKMMVDFVGVSVPVNPQSIILDISFANNSRFFEAISANLFGFHKQIIKDALYPKSLEGYRIITDFRSVTYKKIQKKALLNKYNNLFSRAFII